MIDKSQARHKPVVVENFGDGLINGKVVPGLLKGKQILIHVNSRVERDPFHTLTRKEIARRAQRKKKLKRVIQRIRKSHDSPESLITAVTELFHDLEKVDVARLLGLEVPDDYDPTRPDIEMWMRIAVKNGMMRDTTKIARWLGQLNELVRWSDFGLPPIELVCVHAEEEMEALNELIMEYGFRPFAIIFSGSGKMLDEVWDSPVIQATARCMAYALKHDIPTMGICFGHQLMMRVKYGIMPEYITVPPGMTVRWHRRVGEARRKQEIQRRNRARRAGQPVGSSTGLPSRAVFSSVTPGTRHTIYGISAIRQVQPRARRHPVMHGVADGTPALKVHSMYVSPKDRRIPRGHLQAISEIQFLPSPATSLDKAVPLRIAEVVCPSRYAVGVQSHPELFPLMLILLVHLSVGRNMLESEKQDVGLVLEELEHYPTERFAAGEQFGYNFIFRLALEAQLDLLHQMKLLNAEQKDEILRRVFRRRVEPVEPAPDSSEDERPTEEVVLPADDPRLRPVDTAGDDE